MKIQGPPLSLLLPALSKPSVEYCRQRFIHRQAVKNARLQIICDIVSFCDAVAMAIKAQFK